MNTDSRAIWIGRVKLILTIGVYRIMALFSLYRAAHRTSGAPAAASTAWRISHVDT